MRFFTILIGILLMTSAQATTDHGSAYDYSFKTLMGNKPLALSSFKGEVIMVVNTASKCGFTPQYAALEKLYNTYKAQGFVIIGVPSNDFGKQEPGSSQEIADFCKINYGVTFPMTAKEDVRGEHVHPFYRWAKKELGFGTGPKWNFHKYLINRHGELVDYFNSTTAPDAKRVINAVEKALNEKA